LTFSLQHNQKEKVDDSLLPSPSSLQHNQNEKGDGNFIAIEKKRKRVATTSSLQ
jgi:hypothetical protein